ncbi:hypothetical protein [Sutterella wadsworthensis]|uniref:hypothetical protein n=1 Tax=Sutterella wadsworthensis TaxID=40545 RepID=UPI003975EC16
MANRILVVDDNSDIRENICEYLNLRGHQTIGASDAASAAQLIAEEDIALIVLDPASRQKITQSPETK